MADQAAFTIEEFCERFRISKVTYWRMQRNGTAPRELRIGRKVVITAEASQEWVSAMESGARPRAMPVYPEQAA